VSTPKLNDKKSIFRNLQRRISVLGTFLRRGFFGFLVSSPGLRSLVSRVDSEYPGWEWYHIGIMIPLCDTFFDPCQKWYHVIPANIVEYHSCKISASQHLSLSKKHDDLGGRVFGASCPFKQATQYCLSSSYCNKSLLLICLSCIVVPSSRLYWQTIEVIQVYSPYLLLWNGRTDVRLYGILFTATPPSSPTRQHMSGCRRKNCDIAHTGLKTQCKLVRHPK
jgi:hypothetical protein